MEKFELTVLTTTDVHGYLFSKDYWTRERTNSGLARISTLIKEIRQKTPNVLYFDNGDAIQGSPLEYHHALVNENNVDPTIKALNMMKCDAMTIGNHEFNFGRKVLEKAIEEAEFPIVSANIVDKKSGKPKFGKGYTLFEFENGPTVAYIALTTKFVPYWEEPDYVRDLEFLDPVEVAKKLIKKLKFSGIDIVIIGYHGGLERDPESGEVIANLDGENQGYEMAKVLKDVDAFIFGHQHRSFATKINGVPVIMASSAGKALGIVELEMSKKGNEWKNTRSEVRLVTPEYVDEDIDIVKAIAPYQENVERWLDEVVGESLGDFSVPNGMYARIHETALVNFVNDVQLYYGKSDISATSVFSTNVTGWKKGEIKRRDVMGVYIYSNTLKIFEFTGKEVKDMVEHSATYFDFKNGEITESGRMKGYKYNIFSGISYVIDLEKEIGQRVVSLEKNGKPLDMKRRYTIAVNSYQAGGSGGYTMFLNKKPIREVKIQVAELLIDYIKSRKVVTPRLTGNWKILQAKE